MKPENPINATPQTALHISLRFFVYMTTIALVNFSLRPMAKADSEVFREGMLVENMQLVFLGLTIALFCLGACRQAGFRQLLLLLAAVSSVAFCRELDSFFDKLIPVIGWKWAPFIPVFAIAYACKNKASTLRQLQQFIPSQAFVLLWTGLLIAYPIAQMTGHGNFLRELMQQDYSHRFKRIVEETLELMGYAVLLIGAIESLITIRKLAPVPEHKQ